MSRRIHASNPKISPIQALQERSKGQVIVELEFILDLSEFIRGSNALHKSKPFVFPVHLLPNGLSISPDATVIFSQMIAPSGI